MPPYVEYGQHRLSLPISESRATWIFVGLGENSSVNHSEIAVKEEDALVERGRGTTASRKTYPASSATSSAAGGTAWLVRRVHAGAVCRVGGFFSLSSSTDVSTQPRTAFRISVEENIRVYYNERRKVLSNRQRYVRQFQVMTFRCQERVRWL